MKYIQFPLELKLSVQPFALLEKFRIFAGGGVSINMLQRATLYEKGIELTYSTDVMNPPPVTNTYVDKADVTELGRKTSVFSRVEIGTWYKRVKVAWRLSKSLQDMSLKGLESKWAVPVDNSRYLSGRKYNGAMHEKYFEFVIGYQLF